MSDLERLHAAIEIVAELMLADPAYTPIFERLEKEIKIEAAAQVVQTEAQARARALLRQRAMGSIKTQSISSDAPSP